MSEVRDLDAEARRVVYRVLASLFLYPDDERLLGISAAAPELRRRAEPLLDLASCRAWGRLLDEVTGLSGADAQRLRLRLRLREAYTMLFVSGARGRSCPPYESAHTAEPEQAGLVSAKLGGEYAAVGLRPADAGELPDHVAIELDFLSFLCGKENEAEEPATWMHRRRAFLDRHFLRWLPRFAHSLDEIAPDGIYGRAARIALAFAREDRATIGMPAAAIG